MADLAAIAEIRARLTAGDFTSGSEEVKRSAAQLNAVLDEVEQSFLAAGRSVNTSEKALESFWGRINANVSRANDFARTMERFKQFEAASPGDSRLPLILADIQQKYADLGSAADGAARSQGGFADIIGVSEGSLKRWQTVAIRASQIAGGLSSEFSILGPVATALGASLGGPVALGVTVFSLSVAALVTKMREVPTYTEEARASLQKFSADLAKTNVGQAIGLTAPDAGRARLTGALATGRAIAAGAPTASQDYLAAQATREEVALKIAESRQKQIDEDAAARASQAAAFAQFSRISSPDLDARVQERLNADRAASNPFPQQTEFRKDYEASLKRGEAQRQSEIEELNSGIERQVALLEEANKSIAQTQATREAGLRITELEYRFGTQLTEQEKARVRLAIEQRRQLELISGFQRQATYDFANFLDTIAETGKVSFGALFADILGGFRRMLNQMIAEWVASKIFDNSGFSASNLITAGLSIFGGSSVPSNVGITPQVFGSNPGGFIGARAEGGPVSPGMPYLVGEERPELFVPSSYGTIIPNAGGHTVNISIDARGADPGIIERLRGMVQREVVQALTFTAPALVGAAAGAVSTRLRNTGRGSL